MALNKLFQQFTHNPRSSGESPSAQAVDAQVLTGEPTAGLDAKAAGSPKPLNPVEKGLLEEEIIEAMRSCYDPEIPVNIYDMGLIYEIDIDKNGFADVKMTLTSPGCPVAGTLPGEVERKVAGVEGVTGAKVHLVWEPTWNMDMMSEDARLELGFF
jgi:FeS assembly SUF system protein